MDRLTSSDWKTLRLLSANGRATWAELAAALGVTAPAAADRVHKLEERGFIQGFTAILDPRAMGYTLLAFISVSLERPKYRSSLLKWVQKQGEIQECHHVAGDDDFLLKVRCRDTADLERVLAQIKDQDGIARTRTIVVLSTEKESVAPPLGKPQD
ncbi:MAG: Lrp/AsnC family transcriptional regulator [Bryobacteraceae bacterium]